MNKVDLLQNLVRLYGNKTSEEDLKTYLDAYDELLNENIDYEKLYKLIYENWEYSTLMPSPKFIKGQIYKATIKPETEAETKHVTYNVKISVENWPGKVEYKQPDGFLYYSLNEEEYLKLLKTKIKHEVITVREW